MKIEIKGSKKSFKGEFFLQGDKSIAHRSIIIGALGKGEYKVNNFPSSLDCSSTLDCMRSLGVHIDASQNTLLVKSPGYQNFNKKIDNIYAGNSGTTCRLISGILSGIGIETILNGDESLSKRPMRRIIEPLSKMGAKISSNNDILPLKFNKCDKLKGIEYILPVSSAQVKSAILIAGFLAEGKTKVKEKDTTRDHTERMFQYLGAPITIEGKTISIYGGNIYSKDLVIPGDISSAAFIISCGLLGENYNIQIKDVLLNSNRISFLNILKRMNGDITYEIQGYANNEPFGTVTVKSSKLKGTIISKEEVPSIIDEIPVLSVLGIFSEGETKICGIEELKYKESNRLNAIMENLKLLNVNYLYENDILTIFGGHNIIDKSVEIKTFNDHRIALAFLCAALRNEKSIVIDNWECTYISFPNSLHYFKQFLEIY